MPGIRRRFSVAGLDCGDRSLRYPLHREGVERGIDEVQRLWMFWYAWL